MKKRTGFDANYMNCHEFTNRLPIIPPLRTKWGEGRGEVS